MTKNEIKPTIEQTIYCLKAGSERYPEVCAECQLYGEVGCDHCYDDTNDMAIKCLKQLEQYRAIGTVEELKKIEESFNVISDKVWNYILAGEELLERYEAIGTIEEFKALKEKSVAKEPDYEGDGCWDGHVVIDTWICPNCEKHYEVDYDDYDYCPNCGQHIDHSGLTEDD